jgi:hypothetical protein
VQFRQTRQHQPGLTQMIQKQEINAIADFMRIHME